MKIVINSASEIMTILGGDCWVPIADRSIPKTMVIRIKDVTETRKKGTSEIIDKNMINEIELLNWSGVPLRTVPKSRLTGAANSMVMSKASSVESDDY